MGANEHITNPALRRNMIKTEKVTTTESQRTNQPRGDKNFGKAMIQIPGEFFPHAEFKEALWITMSPKQLKGMNTAGRGGTLRIGKTGTIFKFLAPETIIEAHNHDWQEYESIQSKLLQKIVTYRVGGGQALQVLRGMKRELFKLLNAGKMPSARDIQGFLTESSAVGVPKFKIDTPLVYKNSQRRNWQLTFILADSVGGAKIISAVKQLQKYAAPRSDQSILSIEFPWVFELQTIPEGLIQANFAALTSIQPSWMAPYIKGRPTRCELTLSFVDMSPLFEQTIEVGGIVNVVNSEDSDPGKFGGIPVILEGAQQPAPPLEGHSGR